MELHEAKAILATITYKDHITFRLEGHRLIVSITLTQDVDKKLNLSRGNTLTLEKGFDIEGFDTLDEPTFVYMVYCSLCQTEAHERNEWFRVGGKLYADPHQTIRDRVEQTHTEYEPPGYEGYKQARRVP